MSKAVSANAVSEDEIEQIITLAKEANLLELSIREEEAYVRVVLLPKAEDSRNPPDGANRASEQMEVTASLAAQYLPQHPFRPNGRVKVGQSVRKGDPVGYLLSGPLLTPLLAPCNGRIADLRVEPNRQVDYGTAILSISHEE